MVPDPVVVPRVVVVRVVVPVVVPNPEVVVEPGATVVGEVVTVVVVVGVAGTVPVVVAVEVEVEVVGVVAPVVVVDVVVDEVVVVEDVDVVVGVVEVVDVVVSGTQLSCSVTRPRSMLPAGSSPELTSAASRPAWVSAPLATSTLSKLAIGVVEPTGTTLIVQVSAAAAVGRAKAAVIAPVTQAARQAADRRRRRIAPGFPAFGIKGSTSRRFQSGSRSAGPARYRSHRRFAIWNRPQFTFPTHLSLDLRVRYGF